MDKFTTGSLPCMDWERQDLEQSWKSFKQHVQFMFDGPLKKKDEEEKCIKKKKKKKKKKKV